MGKCACGKGGGCGCGGSCRCGKGGCGGRARASQAQGRPGKALGLVALLVLLAGLCAAVAYVMKITRPANANGSSLPAEGAASTGSASGTPAGLSKPMDAAAADAVLNSSQAYLNKGELEKAEAVLKAAIAQHAGEQRLYIQYAELLTSQKRLAEAYQNYEKALAIGPRDAATEFAAGTVASLSGKLDRAVEHYSAAQVANPADYKAPLYLGQVQVKRDEVDEAKKNLLLAAKLNPEAAVAWGTLADIAIRENKVDIALQHIVKARELQPGVTVWRLIEARALKRQGKAADALQLLVNLNEAEKRSTPVMQLMAECYGMLSRPKDAAEMYASASDDEPGNGPLAFEAAVWFERAKENARGLPYAKRAAALQVDGAAGVVERLAK